MTNESVDAAGGRIAASVIILLLQTLVAWPCWNRAIPEFWPGAPHLGFVDTLACLLLLGLVAHIFRRTK